MAKPLLLPDPLDKRKMAVQDIMDGALDIVMDLKDSPKNAEYLLTWTLAVVKPGSNELLGGIVRQVPMPKRRKKRKK